MWDFKCEIKEWLGVKCLMVWPNVSVGGEEDGKKDWQITEQ